MLEPKRAKNQKQQRRQQERAKSSIRGTTLAFGDFGLMAEEQAWIDSRHIAAARRAITHYVKRGGKVWIRVFPNKPITQKPTETRMGSGKGAVEYYVAVVKPGRVMFELGGVREDVAIGALQRAAQKLPIKSKIVRKQNISNMDVLPDDPDLEVEHVEQGFTEYLGMQGTEQNAALVQGNQIIVAGQIARQDFILFQADQIVSRAINVIDRISPTRIIVRRFGSTYYYLFSPDEFLREVGTANDKQSLTDALRLIEREVTPEVDAYDSVQSIPSYCVITENGRVIGFLDPSLSRKQQPKRGKIQELEELSNTSPVTRFVQADFPQEITLGDTSSLLVWLIRHTSEQRALPIALAPHSTIYIVVQTRGGFRLEGRGEGSLIITDEDETLPIQFMLRATSLGTGHIRILCFQGGQSLGYISLTATVVPKNQPLENRRINDKINISVVNVPPDLTLLIDERKNQGQREITLRLTAVDPDLGLNFKPFGPTILHLEPLQYFREFFNDIERLRWKTPTDLAVANKKIALKGATLFERLLPEDLRILLWDIQDRISSVQIMSEEPWIPWELLKLQGKKDGRVIDGPFLCEKFDVTRWMQGVPRRRRLTFQHIAIAVPTDSGLSFAEKERSFLLSLADAQRQVTEVPPFYVDIIEALSNKDYDGWHFTGHGQLKSPDALYSTIILQDGEQLAAGEIAGQVRNSGHSQPLVFLNACQTGRQSLSLTGIGSWAHSFIDAGAAVFIGSLWEVYDEAAYKFAESFYRLLLDGKPVGQAVREARKAIKKIDDPSWLAYTVFADPLTMLK